MEQPTLAPNVHNPTLAPNISITSATATEGSVKPNRPPLLRRVSRSEAHLDLPQWNMPEKDTNTWQRKLSGLFEVGSSALNLSKLVGSRENVYHHNTDLQVEQPLERKLSALELGAAENKESNIPLRKSSTVAELQPFPPVSRLEIKHQASSSSLFNYPTNLDHHHDQGLTMNVRAPAAAATLAGAASIATGLGGHSGASDNSANLQSGSSSQPKGWGFFSGSFLSKPAYKNEEENRRYIMAFDRY